MRQIAVVINEKKVGGPENFRATLRAARPSGSGVKGGFLLKD
jgi:hypothetical protein